MAEPLYELLVPYFSHEASTPSLLEPQTTHYLTRLTTLSLPDLTSNEPASLSQSAQSHLRNLQALSKRSHKAVISSTSHLASLATLLPSLDTQTRALSDGLPELETTAASFAQKYDRNTENEVLDRRKRALLLSQSADRVADVLELPTLLASTISVAQSGGTGSASYGGGTTSYSSALDLQGHVKRLTALFPRSELVETIAAQSEMEIQNLASILITALQNPSLKLAAAIRTVGWLRRVAPELVEDSAKPARPTSTKSLSLSPQSAGSDGALGSLFLVCRLRTLHHTLEALDPLRELADQETAQRRRLGISSGKSATHTASSSGSQSERYLKRYIETFREQSFNILSMYRSIFPSDLPTADVSKPDSTANGRLQTVDTLLPLPSPVASFALHLVDLLSATLREYMLNVQETSARESLLTQVLYCAGSLGRLGAEFGMMIALLEEDLHADESLLPAEPGGQGAAEWAQVMKKHRVQASRLEVLARGVGGGKKGGADVPPPGPATPPTLAA